MQQIETYSIYIFAAIAVFIAAKLFSLPIKWKLAFNTLLSFCLLILYNLIGTYFGFSLGINLINASVIGLFGLPGLVLLWLLKWLLSV